VGKASKRKNQRRQGTGLSRADFERQRAFAALHAGAGQIARMLEGEREREAQAAKMWCGGVTPKRATLPSWAPDSVGDRFFSDNDIAAAAAAPPLADAILPAKEELSQDPAHRAVAILALVRGIALDGLDVSDPAVAALTDLLTPVVTKEFACAEDDAADPEFSAGDGPLFQVGGCVLVDATWAIVGLEPLEPVVALLERRLDDAHTGLGTGLTGAVVAEALVRAFAGSYRCEMPGDAECLKRLGPTRSGNPLHDLILAKAIAPENSLRLGLIVLGVLADLARTDAMSVLSAERASVSEDAATAST
jgi:hypothetical protein